MVARRVRKLGSIRVPAGGSAVFVVMTMKFAPPLAGSRKLPGVGRARGETNRAARLHLVEGGLQISAGGTSIVGAGEVDP